MSANTEPISNHAAALTNITNKGSRHEASISAVEKGRGASDDDDRVSGMHKCYRGAARFWSAPVPWRFLPGRSVRIQGLRGSQSELEIAKRHGTGALQNLAVRRTVLILKSLKRAWGRFGRRRVGFGHALQQIRAAGGRILPESLDDVH